MAQNHDKTPAERAAFAGELNRLILDFITGNGMPVQEKTDPGGTSAYGWLARSYTELNTHLRDCGINYTKSTWEDAEWSEFAGTFAEPPWENRTGIDAVVYCNCGRIAGRRWRYRGSHAELLRGITEGRP